MARKAGLAPTPGWRTADGHRGPASGARSPPTTRSPAVPLPGYRVERPQPIAQGGILAILGVQYSKAGPPAPFPSMAGRKKTGH